ncbi:TIGR01906 family membrane protein [Brevibacterium sp.]|uniref:TIGR01906 family membrane protein n=1 Tax=Brevibacterium sp. TaxID=1701 RepID=UPI0025C55D49|nr:TIGR01906 family membrane protein [Brevibacterium sp.]
MTPDDPHEPEDLLSRRLSSQPEGDEPTAAQLAAPAEDDAAPERADDGTEAAETAGSGTELEDTQVFDPFDEPGAGSKPALISEEEWALIGAGTAAGAPTVASQTPAAAETTASETTRTETASAQTAPAKPTRAERRAAKRAAKLDADREEAAAFAADAGAEDRRRNPLDIVGAVWIALSLPFIIAALAVRVVASGTFLKWTYFWRPGFPEDQYGFTAEDRLHYGSYTVDYLYNLDSARYLGDVVTPDGVPVFTAGELAHMADVKALIGLLTLIAIIAAIGTILLGLYKCRAGGSGMRGSLRAGAILTVALFAVLGVLGALGWDRFFTGFHEVFFAEGTWTFYLDDSLIRLFPPQFWVDAGVGAGVIALVLCAFAFGISFVGRSRRARA